MLIWYRYSIRLFVLFVLSYSPPSHATIASEENISDSRLHCTPILFSFSLSLCNHPGLACICTVYHIVYFSLCLLVRSSHIGSFMYMQYAIQYDPSSFMKEPCGKDLPLEGTCFCARDVRATIYPYRIGITESTSGVCVQRVPAWARSVPEIQPYVHCGKRNNNDKVTFLENDIVQTA